MKRSILLVPFCVLFVLILSTTVFAEEAPVASAPSAETTPSTEATATVTPAASPAATPSQSPTVDVVKEVEKTKETVAVQDSDDSSDRYGKKNRPLGDFLVGPYVTGVAIPRPISFGAEMKWKDVLGFSAGYGFFPQVTLDEVKMKISALDFRVKVYPFKGSFSIGAGIGTQKLTGQTSQIIDPSPTATDIMLTQDNFYVAPQLGWNWVWNSGFFMGMDLGVQLSISRKTQLTTNALDAIKATADYKKLEKDVNDMSDLLGKIPLPLLTLLKVGYFF